MALQPFSTLATYVPEGDQDTELMAELQKQMQKNKQNQRESKLRSPDSV